MELSHRFTVPTGVEETWAHFQDLAALAECFPGAQLTSADEESFAGSVKVKLGPIALVYTGSGTFVEKDESAHRFVVDAKGKDKRGNGTAGAHVTVAMSGTESSTDVAVSTDLAVTGKPAQFGRGVMQDVSDKLLGQFVACLEDRLTEQGPEAEPPPGGPAAPAPPPPTPPTSVGPAASVAPVAGAPGTPPVVPPGGPAEPAALDLGAAVLPVLARTYWRQALGAVLVLLVLRRLLSR